MAWSLVHLPQHLLRPCRCQVGDELPHHLDVLAVVDPPPLLLLLVEPLDRRAVAGSVVPSLVVLVVAGASLGLLVGAVLGVVMDEALPVVGLGDVPGVGLGLHLGAQEAGVPLLIPPEGTPQKLATVAG